MSCKKQKPKPKEKPRTRTRSPPNVFKLRPTLCCVIDPVKRSNFNDQLLEVLKNVIRIVPREQKKDFRIQPDISKLVQLSKRPDPILPAPRYTLPLSTKEKKAKTERRLKAERRRNVCKWEVLDMGPFYKSGTIWGNIKTPCPNVNPKTLTVKPKDPCSDATSIKRKSKSGGPVKRKKMG